MKNNFYKESVVALVLGIILVLILNPAHFWMPSMAHVSMLLALLGVFGFYASYILRDETVPWILFGPFVLATVSYWLFRSPIVWAFTKQHIVCFLRWSTTYESRRAA